MNKIKKEKKEVIEIQSFQKNDVPIIEPLIPSNKKWKGLILKKIPIGSLILSISRGKKTPVIHCKKIGINIAKFRISLEIALNGEMIKQYKQINENNKNKINGNCNMLIEII